MSKPTVSWFAALVTCLLALPTIVRAQAASATLSGTVVDESASVVPDVRVTVVNLGTGLQRSTTCGAQGTFVASLLPPGRYRLTAERTGFITAQISEIVLNVGDAIDVKLLLKVAGVDTAVSVTAEASRINTSPAVVR